MELNEAPEVYERIIWKDDVDATQIKLVVNTFREIEYLSLRKYYRDFNSEWCPSNVGVTMALDIDNTRELFRGMAEIISLAESREIIEEYFGDIIKEIYQK